MRRSAVRSRSAPPTFAAEQRRLSGGASRRSRTVEPSAAVLARASPDILPLCYSSPHSRGERIMRLTVISFVLLGGLAPATSAMAAAAQPPIPPGLVVMEPRL